SEAPVYSPSGLSGRGCHFHFFEVNRALVLDRAASFGRRLNIPSGQAVRFEPGQTQRVTLVALGGKGLVHGCNRLTKSSVRSATQKRRALARLQEWMG
ncbi:urease subunit beta, partial [Synechococcus sp. 'PEA 65AY6A-5F PE A']